MFRYYQKSDTDEWAAGTDKTDSPWDFAADHGASRVSVLSVNNDIDLVEQSQLKYRGPLYFDIDHTDLNIAIQSGITLCKKLLSMGVEERDLEIHLSGMKGLHIFVSADVFSNNVALRHLPKIYEQIALDLYVVGMDMQVYSEKRGRMFRPPNSLRPDGKYKVQTTFKELLTLSVERYKKLVSSRRDLNLAEKPKAHATKLAMAWQSYKKFKPEKPVESRIPDEMFSLLEGEAPQCVKDLCDGNESQSGNNNFNKTAINIGCWAVRAGKTMESVDSIFTRIAENCESKKYKSASDRLAHLRGVFSYVNGDKKYNFSCASMQSCITTKPCRRCPIKNPASVDSNMQAGMAELFLHEHMGQYYQDAAFERPVTSFTMERQWVVACEDTDRTESSVVTITSPQKGKTYKLTDFHESAWNSKQNFKAELQGLDGVAFLGTDNDVTRLRLTIARDSITGVSEVRQIYKVTKIGLHYKRRLGPPNVVDKDHKGMFIYVEPEFSLTSRGQLDSYVLVGQSSVSPNLKIHDFTNNIDDRTNLYFDKLLHSNKPEIIAQILAWNFATHLKTHFYTLYGRFPPLCISGVAGVGKNALTSVFQRLSGLSGEAAGATLEAPQCTKLPFQQDLTNSTTVPRVINELNPKSVTKSQYNSLIELLKASFDSMSIRKGRLGGGDRSGANVSSVEWKITAPVVTLSEEPISVPAVLQRAIMLQLDPIGHSYGREAFVELEQWADELLPMSTVLIDSAMQTSCKDLDKQFKSTHLPKKVSECNLPERSKYGYKVLLVALNWGIFHLKSRGLSDANIRTLETLREEFIDYMEEYADEIAIHASLNEVDKVIRDIALLANNDEFDQSKFYIQHGKHYIKDAGYLYLDILVIFPILERFKQGSMQPLGIKSAEAMLASCKGLAYFVSSCASHNLLNTSGRGVLKLDVELLRQSAIPVEMFK